MKKTLIIMLGIALLVASVAYGATIANSKHDMTTYITNETSTEICVYCHTPHAGNLNAPLWNRNNPTTSYNLYNSTTLDGTIAQPTGVSLACLSCHDGTIAINQVINTPSVGDLGTTFNYVNINVNGKLFQGAAYLGSDLSNDHPINLTYRDDVDSALRADANAKVTYSGKTLPLFGSADPYKVECASCHAVHDPANVPFLRYANTNSQLCLICHNK